jgi:hypothetical protein
MLDGGEDQRSSACPKLYVHAEHLHDQEHDPNLDRALAVL